jgi:hypothetical protein
MRINIEDNPAITVQNWQLGYVSFPKIPSGLDSHRKAESSHP